MTKCKELNGIKRLFGKETEIIYLSLLPIKEFKNY